MRIGMIFPGQGSQHLGMGRELYEKERIVQEFFEQASTCLDTNFVKLCFASSEKELTKTVNAQTSIFLISTAIFSLLQKKYGITPDILAGHSLGEYSALFAGGGINFADAFYLLQKRSQFMDAATTQQNGGMVAILGMPVEDVRNICATYDNPESDESVAQIVNINSSQQVVVSGTIPELEAVRKKVKESRGRAIPLKVAGAFHSRLMKGAEDLFSQYLIKVDFNDLQIPVINNLQAKSIRCADDVKKSLAKQTSSSVLWWQSMRHFQSCDLILEIGPGTNHSRLLKREWPEKTIFSVNLPEDIERVLECERT